LPLPSLPVATWRTLDQAARQLGVSRRTLTRWVTAGRVKAYTIAGDKRRYVDMDELRRLREPKPIEPPKRGGGEA
jgi:excisionase family DNA binding protein